MNTATLKKVSQLDQLKRFSKVVADTGDFETMRAYKPQDATTNPSLIFAAAQKPEYAALLDQALADLKNSPLSGSAKVEAVMDNLLVIFGLEIPGYVQRVWDISAAPVLPWNPDRFARSGDYGWGKLLGHLLEHYASAQPADLIGLGGVLISS